MAATTRKAWSKPKPAGNRSTGKWSKVAPREGGVFEHPSGKFVARKMGFVDSHHDTREAAQAHVDKWNENMKKFSEI